MAKAFNPYEHHHDHGHDHDHDHSHEPLDPAQRSLADSLRVSFGILKLVMIVLIVLYLISGVFVVRTGEAAVVLRFGRLVGGGGEESQLVQPGKLNFALPFPFDQIVRIPTTVQTMPLDGSFWYQPAENQAADPEQAIQGALLTGDANVIHGRWKLQYKVTRPVDFVRNLANLKVTDAARMLKEAEGQIKAAMEEGLIHAAAHLQADELLKKQTGRLHAMAIQHAQGVLTKLGCGVEIHSLTADDIVIPKSVEEAYQRVISAQNESANARAKANKERAEILGGAAGEAHEPLWDLVKRYEIAVEAGKADEVNAIDTAMRQALTDKSIEWQGRKVAISGDVAAAISAAEGYRSQIENDARRDAEAFRKLKTDYDANPRIFLSREWQNVKERIFTNPEIDVFVLPPSEIRVHLSRDPKLQQKREEERTKKIKEDNDKKAAGG